MQQDVPVPGRDQKVGDGGGGGVVVGGHGIIAIVSRDPVDQHRLHVLRLELLRAKPALGAHRHQHGARHAPIVHPGDKIGLAVFALARRGDDHVVSGFFGGALKPGDQSPEKRAFKVGHDGADDAAVFAPEARGKRVYPVIERLDRFVHTLGIGGFDGGDSAHDLGNGGRRNAGFPRNIVNRRPSRRLARFVLRHGLPPCLPLSARIEK